jgi:hypothetical protein
MYDVNNTLLKLIESDNWGEYSQLVGELKASHYWDMFYDALVRLKRDALYVSPVHGVGHIERTLFHGAFCAMSELLNEADTRLLMGMCSYHDTGRANDWLDSAHGLRSALKLDKLVGDIVNGEDMKIIKAGIEAHSLPDGVLDEIIENYKIADTARAKKLAELLKDADGLDRVRIGDLNVKYLRRQNSRSRAGFAQYLFERYIELTGETAADEFKDGFEISTVVGVKDFISKCFADNRSCAQTLLLCLGNLNKTEIGEQLLAACIGLEGNMSRCGLIDAALLYMGIIFSENGFSQENIKALCNEYIVRFSEQYSSDRCSDIRRAVNGTHSCESLTVDAALFAYRFINENKLK